MVRGETRRDRSVEPHSGEEAVEGGGASWGAAREPIREAARRARPRRVWIAGSAVLHGDRSSDQAR